MKKSKTKLPCIDCIVLSRCVSLVSNYASKSPEEKLRILAKLLSRCSLIQPYLHEKYDMLFPAIEIEIIKYLLRKNE